MAINYRDYETGSQPVSAAMRKPLRKPRAYETIGKRAVDIVVVLLALPAVLPVIVGFALLIMLDGGNPFYSQKRVGRNNRIFRMWKLRSMVPNAKESLGRYLDANPAAKAEWDDKQKLSNDPRITGIGRFIRKFSIDELPQLLNVLLGDMSLIGPRPMMPEQRALYPGRAYYRLRPGITGTWQVSDRNETSFAGRAVFDEEYENALSAWTDFAVALSTVRVIFKGTGC